MRLRTSNLLTTNCRIPVFCAGVVLLVGCANTANQYQAPELTLPAKYQQTQKIVHEDDEVSTPLSTWWQMLQDTELDALIDQALANNSDLKMATLRMAQAKVQLEQARLGALPEVKAPINLGLGSGSSSIATIVGSWRVDLWGEQRSTLEAANFVMWQAVFERDELQRNLVAEIINSYLQLLLLNERMRISRHQESLLDEMLSKLKQRMELGDATVLEQDQLLSSLFSARAAIPALQDQREQLLISLSALLGTLPTELRELEFGLDRLAFPEKLPALSPHLLLQRPDVRVAEARLFAADANIEVARAKMLPPLDLGLQMGTSLLLDGSLSFVRALAGITISIFNRDKLQQEVERKRLSQEEMVEGYAKTLYRGVREVESALSTIEQNRKRLRFQQEVAEASKRSWDHIAEMYKIGTLDYLSLLNAESMYLRYLDEYFRLQFELNRTYVALFQSLGGGVESLDEEQRVMVPSAKLKVNSTKRTQKTMPIDGIDWDGGKIEEFWLLELPGLHQQHTIAAVWRDLRNRFPEQMQQRFVRPVLFDQVGEGSRQVAWYRLYLGKLNSSEAAEQLCAELKAKYQRCRVVFSRSIQNKDE